MNNVSQSVIEGIKHSITTKGIAYTYSNTGEVKDTVLLNPEWVGLHSEPMCIIDINDNVVSYNGHQLIFKNKLVAEGALMAMQLLMPEESKSFIIDIWTKEKSVSEIKAGV